MGGARPQGTPGAGGLRLGPGGAALCLTSADIDPRAAISSPMGGAGGLLRNSKTGLRPCGPWWVYGPVGAAPSRDTVYLLGAAPTSP